MAFMALTPCVNTKVWTLIDSKAPQNNISYAGIDFEELLIVGIATEPNATNKIIFSQRISKEEIDLLGNNNGWYAMGGYYTSSSYSYANFAIYGSDNSVRTNVITSKGQNTSDAMWYVYYR